MILDERTWEAISAAGAPPHIPGGEIVVAECLLTDTEPPTHEYHVPDFPVEIPLGHTVYGTGAGENTAGYNQEMQISLELIDPDGESRGYNTWRDLLLPGHHISLVTGNVEIDKEGVWKFHVKLENEGIFEEKTWDALATPGAIEAKFPWTWLGIGAAALGLILLVKPKKKKT